VTVFAVDEKRRCDVGSEEVAPACGPFDPPCDWESQAFLQPPGRRDTKPRDPTKQIYRAKFQPPEKQM